MNPFKKIGTAMAAALIASLVVIQTASAQTFSPNSTLSCFANNAKYLMATPGNGYVINYAINIPTGMTGVDATYRTDLDSTRRLWGMQSGPTDPSQANRLYTLEIFGFLGGVRQDCTIEIQFYGSAATNPGTSPSSSAPTVYLVGGRCTLTTAADTMFGTTKVKQKQIYCPGLSETETVNLYNAAIYQGMRIHGLDTALAGTAASGVRTAFGGSNTNLQNSINQAGAIIRTDAGANGGFTNYGAANARHKIVSDGSVVDYLNCAGTTSVCGPVVQVTMADPVESNAVRLVVVYSDSLMVTSADPAMAALERGDRPKQAAAGNMPQLINVFIEPPTPRLDGLKIVEVEKDGKKKLVAKLIDKGDEE